MIDISDVKMDAIEGGYAILPVSDMKKVIIPSPPSVNMVPTNPRPAVIYLTAAAITPDSANVDALKAYAKENKVVFLCPGSAEVGDMVEFYQCAFAKARTLNIKKDAFSVKSDAASLELANTLVEALEDEEAELDAAEVFVL